MLLVGLAIELYGVGLVERQLGALNRPLCFIFSVLIIGATSKFEISIAHKLSLDSHGGPPSSLNGVTPTTTLPSRRKPFRSGSNPQSLCNSAKNNVWRDFVLIAPVRVE